jgi:hypothetical protein
MSSEPQRREIDVNYDAFQRNLASHLERHRGHYALMHDGQVVDFFPKPGDALRAGKTRFGDDVFSIQEVTDEPIDLGFFSHVSH